MRRFLFVALTCAMSSASHVFGDLVGAERPQAKVDAVLSVGIVVDDLDRSIDFYTRTLNFRVADVKEIVGDDAEALFGVFGMRARVATLSLGSEQIRLIDYLTPGGRPMPADSRSNDRWFQHIAIVVTDMDRAYARLREAKVGFASTGPQTLPLSNPNAGGIRAFYFRDPDNHVLELIQFPADKGDPRWQRSTELFAGIDHTAIVVTDTETSLRFYRDALGLRVAGESENVGTEQAHLNNVRGAHLRITGLRAVSGPGVELLEYLAPQDGRPLPADPRLDDQSTWLTIVGSADVEDLFRSLRDERQSFVSPTVVTAAGAGFGVSRAAIVRDPDGHAIAVSAP
ncbi:MAG: VOC family protein [Tepidisphaeraceae bacterium]